MFFVVCIGSFYLSASCVSVWYGEGCSITLEIGLLTCTGNRAGVFHRSTVLFTITNEKQSVSRFYYENKIDQVNSIFGQLKMVAVIQILNSMVPVVPYFTGPNYQCICSLRTEVRQYFYIIPSCTKVCTTRLLNIFQPYGILLSKCFKFY